MKADGPAELLNRVYDVELGFRLTNFSIKPVHVANGLARALVGRTYDTTALARMLRRYVRNQRLGIDEERNPNAAVLGDYGRAFESLHGSEPNLQSLTRLRSLAFDVLAADQAVFPDHQSFTLANERLVTSDPSDLRMGRFLGWLLTSPPEQTDAADYIRELLRSETDAWTTLALPMLQFGTARDVAEADNYGVSLASPTLRGLREAYDRLARFERAMGSKLNSLRRFVLFGCFVAHVHTISRWCERDAGAPRPPILLDFLDGTAISVRQASGATMRAAGDAVEGLVRFCIREQVLAVGLADDVKEALSTSPMKDKVRELYENYLEGGGEAVEAFTRALVEAAFAEVREHPIGALIELGRRAGYLTPWSNHGRGGKLQKRYAATAEFLETLVAAIVAPDEPLEFPEFLDRLRGVFGIVIGRPEDDTPIRFNNLSDGQFGPPTTINEEDLRLNVRRMQQLLVETGYAKLYADGRIVVTTQPQGSL